MRKKYTPYSFHEKTEYKIYARIGKRYQKECLKKNRKNHTQGLEFDKYSEWEKYFINKFLMSDYNACNFLHYLIGNLRVYQIFEGFIKNLMMPLYVAILTIVMTIYKPSQDELFISLLGGTIFITIIGMLCSIAFGKTINFYEDCIKIIENNVTSHQK